MFSARQKKQRGSVRERVGGTGRVYVPCLFRRLSGLNVIHQSDVRCYFLVSVTLHNPLSSANFLLFLQLNVSAPENQSRRL